LKFNSGSIATIGIAPETAKLVTKWYRKSSGQ
jgi:hypothetical protein